MSSRLYEQLLFHANRDCRRVLQRGGGGDVEALTRALSGASGEGRAGMSAVAVRLLEVTGEGFPARLDGVLGLFFARDTSEVLLECAAEIAALLSRLPDRRGGALRGGLVEGWGRVASWRSRRVVKQAAAALGELKPGALGVALRVAEGAQDGSAGWRREGVILVLDALIGREAWPPRLDPFLREELSRDPESEVLHRVLLALDEGRREALLLGHRRVPWAALRVCLSEPVMRMAIESAKVDNLQDMGQEIISGTLAAFGAPILPHLNAALAGDPGLGKEAMLGALLSLADETSVGVLVGLLGDRQASVSLRAVEALAVVGPEGGLEGVKGALSERRVSTRMGAAAVLARWQPDPRAASVAREALEVEPSPEVRHRLESQLEIAAGSLRREYDLLLSAPPRLVESPRTLDHLCRRGDFGVYLRTDPMGGLVFVIGWLNSRSWNEERRRELWREALEANLEAPVAAWAALKGVERFADLTREQYMARFCPIFGTRLRRAILEALEGRAEAWRGAAYGWALESPGVATAQMHRVAIEDSSEALREQGVRGFVAMGGASREALIELLGSARADTRRAAAEGLSQVGDASALGALRAALEAERSERVREALERARAACDPRVEVEVAVGSGAYVFEEALSLSAGLSELRGLVHDAPGEAGWVRLCTLLERFEAVGALSLALDYAREPVLGRWPAAIRVAPVGWGGELKGLAGDGAHDKWLPWLPIHALTAPAGVARFKSMLREAEKGSRDRKLKLELLPVFLEVIERAWAFCEAHGLPMEGLEVRFDGGGGYGPSAKTTVVELLWGFGVTVSRGRTREVRASAGLRLLRVKVPKGHGLRARHATGGRGMLDLSSILDLEGL